MYLRFPLSFMGLFLIVAACSQTQEPAPNPTDEGVETEATWPMPSAEDVRDAFTYSNYNDVRVTHVDLDLDVLFDEFVGFWFL